MGPGEKCSECGLAHVWQANKAFPRFAKVVIERSSKVRCNGTDQVFKDWYINRGVVHTYGDDVETHRSISLAQSRGSREMAGIRNLLPLACLHRVSVRTLAGHCLYADQMMVIIVASVGEVEVGQVNGTLARSIWPSLFRGLARPPSLSLILTKFTTHRQQPSTSTRQPAVTMPVCTRPLPSHYSKRIF
jgi:hypothetical protein